MNEFNLPPKDFKMKTLCAQLKCIAAKFRLKIPSDYGNSEETWYGSFVPCYVYACMCMRVVLGQDLSVSVMSNVSTLSCAATRNVDSVK